MKYILLLLISLNCFSQQLVLNGKDEFTDDYIIKANCSESAKYWHDSDKITKGVFNYVYLTAQYEQRKSGQENIFFTLNIKLGVLNCLTKNESRVIFIFEDGTKIESVNFAETKCDYAELVGYYSITKEELTIFSSKKILKFRVYFSENYSEYEIKSGKAEAVMKTFEILNTAISEKK